MKKITLIVFSITMMFLLTSCGNNGFNLSSKQMLDSSPATTANKNVVLNTNPSGNTENDKGKVLVAYFSHSGHTRQVASHIHNLVGGDIFEIKTVNPYPKEYHACTEIAKKEKEENIHPQLTSKVENMEDYDVIFIGYPIWWYTAPMAAYTFLESYDLSGKTVIPFCTSGGSDISESMSAIKVLCPNSKVLQGLTANSIGDVKPWLENFGVVK